MNALSIPPIAMATLMFYVALYHFLIYRRQKDSRENLTFALSCVGVGLYSVFCAGLYNVSSPEAGVEWQRFQVITLAAIAAALLWFIADYTGHASRKIVQGFSLYYLIAALTGLLIRSDLTWTSIPSIKEISFPFGYVIRYNEMTPGILTNFQSVVGLFYSIYIFMVSLKFYRSGNKEKGLALIIAIAMIFVGTLNDTFVSSGFYDFIYILEYSYIGMILVVTLFLTNKVIMAGETKKALLESEEKYRSLTNNLNVGIYRNSIDAKGMFIEANPAIVKMFGFDDKNDFLKLKVSDLYKNPEDKTVYNMKLLKNNEIKGEELQLQKKDGTEFIGCVSAVVVKDKKGEAQFFDGVIEDITERKHSQEALRKSENKYRTLFEKSADAIFVVDRETGKYLEVNKAGEKLAGRSASELKKLTIKEVTPEKAKLRAKDIASLKETSKMGEVAYLHPDGTRRIAKLTVVPLDENTVYGIAQDITERKRSEKKQQMLQKNLMQAQKIEAVGTLAGGIAHDFNNILSGIFGYSQLAESHINDPERAKADIKNIVKGASRATELVQQILTFSRKKEYEKQFLNLFVIVKEALKLIRSTIPSTIEIKENINSKATIFADPTQMHQLMMNLCTNAYHAMSDSGGELKVRLNEIQMSDQQKASMKNTQQNKYVELEIADTGQGMDEDTMGKIFNPYFTTKTREKGTGLGLAIVHAIVEEHNGIIRVNSTIGKGSTFSIYLPIVEKKETTDNNELAEQEIEKGSETILFVEDEESIRSFAQEFLAKYGYTLTMAENGQKAYETFKQDPNRFDIVITDMTMPKMNGDELSEKILKIRKDIPIILCTGYSEKLNAALAKKIGIRQYIEKPFAGKEMCSLIREVLDNENEKVL